MWNQKLKSLLQHFLQSKDPTEIENFFVEQTQSLIDPDATQALSSRDIYEGTENSFSMEQLQSMNFNLPSQDTPTVELGTDRYRAVSKLGQGGMATVWQMQDNQLLRTVALKQLRKEKSESNYEQENFVVEAQITAQLQHPGIVPIHDLQQDADGNIYFTMREIQGQTLEDIISAVHRISDTRWKTTHSGWNLRRLIDALENICQTVSYANTRGVIHQDLKPANIMVGDFGEVLVVDWGVARVRSLYHSNPNWVRIKASHAFVEHKKVAISGTPRYMAPEQIHGDPEKIDGRADVYALGVILYYILTKEKPFEGTMPEILRIKKTNSASILDFFQEVPEALAVPQELIDICEKAMAFNPADRFSDAKEMQLAIQSWLDGARQEEEARQIIREIDRLQQEINRVQQMVNQLTPSLNIPSIHDSSLSDDWWTQWCQRQEFLEQIDTLRDAIYQKAQGAILYAPHLPEIYDRLIALEYQDYLDALLEGNHKSISKTERRLNAYLHRIPAHEQAHWQNIRAVDLASLQAQKSHGVNIERRTEKEHLLEALQQHRWMSIVGLAGVGKTHLAWQVATEWCKSAGWDVVFCDVTDCITPASLLQRLTQSLGVQQTGSDPFDLTISILNRTHPKFQSQADSSILIIDNAESLNPKAVQILGTILERCPKLRLLSTTRRHFDHPKEQTFTLHAMSLLNGIDLFAQHCKQQLPSWSLTEQNRNQVFTIVNTLDRIPLAIELAGARIAEFSLIQIVTRLEERFALLRSNSAEQPTLQMALSWSCTSLSELEKQVLYQLSVIPARFTLPLGEAIVDLPKGNSLSDVLDVLTQHSLINREYLHGVTSYTMLKSIRDYASTQAEDLLIQATHHRMGTHLAHLIQSKQTKDLDKQLIRSGSKHGAPQDAVSCCAFLLADIKQFGPMITGLEIASDFLARTDLTQKQRRVIILHQIDLLQDSGQVEETLATLQAISKTLPSLQMHVATQPLNAIRSPFRTPLTTIPTTPDNALEAQYAKEIQRHQWEHALETAKQRYAIADSPDAQCALLQECIVDFSSGGQLRQALGLAEHLEELLLIQERERLPLLIDIAVLHTRLGNREQAIERYHLALDLAELEDATESQARIIGNLGLLYQADGNYELAIRQYERARNIFETLEQPEKISALNGNLGTIYHERGDIPQAMTHFNQAIDLAISCNNAINQGVFLGNRAMCAIDIKDYQQAQLDLEQAIEICDRHLEFAAGAFRGELALVYMKQGQPEQARRLLSKGEPQVQEHKEQYGKFLCRKASVFYAIHDHDQVKEALRRAESLCLELQVRATSSLQHLLNQTQKEIPASVWLTPIEIEERNFVGQVAFKWAKYEILNSRYPQAMHHLSKALHLFELLGDIDMVLQVKQDIAITQFHTGKVKEAISLANETRHQHQLNGNPIAYGTVTNFLGGCHRRLGETAQALAYHRESLEILGQYNHIRQVAALEKAGLCCRIMGNYEEALHYLEQALDMALQNNQRPGTLYCNVGLCHNVMGDEEQALKFYHLGIQELKRVGDRNRASLYLGNIANIYAQQGRYDEAKPMYEEMITISVETGVKANECLARGNYGDMLVKMKDYEEGKRQLEMSIGLGLDTYPIATHVFRTSLANMYSLQQQHDQAVEALELVDAEFLQSDVEEYTKFLCVSGMIYWHANQSEKAHQALQLATVQIQQQQFADNTEAHQKWVALQDLLQSPTE